MDAASTDFDYEAKVWGSSMARISPVHMQALRLKYCLDALPGGRVIDIGCGAGNMPKAIKHYRPGLDVYGLEFAHAAVTEAQRDARGVTFIEGSADQLPLADGSFDAAVMFDVLEHVPDPPRLLAEVTRILRPGGVFHVFCPLEGDLKNPYGWLWKLGWKAKRIHCGHIQQFTTGTLERAVRDAGLELSKRVWSLHPFFCMVDIGYFTMLWARGATPRHSVEGMIETMGDTPSRKALAWFKNALVATGYVESTVLKRLPGGGEHLTATKPAAARGR
jgi:SAM-dependent methyltransferase